MAPDEATESPMSTTDSSSDSTATFESLGVIPELCTACKTLNFKHATPIQAAAIPEALAGRDIIGLAETGSGKTAAFAIPILQALMTTPSPLFACVLVPTRELAFQISSQFEALGAGIGVKVATITGGMDNMTQAIALSKKPHIVVASPGRLLDHLESTKGFSLRTMKYLVLDEADRLLDVDFGAILDKLLSIFPKDRHTYLFSATMTSKVAKLQRASLSNPVRVAVNTKYTTVSTLIQSYLFFPFKYKDTYLVFLLNEMPGQSCIVFARTCNDTQRLAFLLRSLGFKAVPIHGQLSQSSRLGALNKFRSGERNILIATDVAARGLDIPQVDCVVNFDIPTDSKSYIHRVGRTARAGRAGKSLSLVTQYDLELFLRIETALGKKLDEYKVEKDEVLLLQERVGEAQREAILKMKELHEKKGPARGKNKGGKNVWGVKGGKIEKNRDNMDREEV